MWKSIIIHSASKLVEDDPALWPKQLSGNVRCSIVRRGPLQVKDRSYQEMETGADLPAAIIEERFKWMVEWKTFQPTWEHMKSHVSTLQIWMFGANYHRNSRHTQTRGERDSKRGAKGNIPVWFKQTNKQQCLWSSIQLWSSNKQTKKYSIPQ